MTVILLLLMEIIVGRSAILLKPTKSLVEIQTNNFHIKSIPRYEDDPKEYFFRNVKVQEDDEELASAKTSDLPRPDGLKVYFAERNKRGIIYKDLGGVEELALEKYLEEHKRMNKRSMNYKVLPSRGLRSHFETIEGKHRRNHRSRRDMKDADASDFETATQKKEDVEKHLGKPLELAILEAENKTKSNISQSVIKPTNLPEVDDVDVEINDFIRFRRSATTNDKNVQCAHIDRSTEQLRTEDMGTPIEKHGHEIKEDRTGRMLLEADRSVPEGSREPRGATKEQWIKHPYLVDGEDSYLSNDNIRAPRVHFVTQRRLDTSSSHIHPSYDRSNAARDLDRELAFDLSRDVMRDMNDDYYTRLYRRNPYVPTQYSDERYDPYYRHDDRRHFSRYDSDKYYNYERQRPVQTKQRRIIYYTTLPEVVRTPPNVDLRDIYNYRNRYDGRYVTSSPISPTSGDVYSYRKPYSYSKSRYDHDLERTKTPYPLKVSTDVNVREIKKNPERRIYSEADSRYAYKADPYQADERFQHQ